MESNSTYLLLLLLAGVGFFLQIQWMFLLVAVLFFALIFSQAYAQMSSAPAAVEHMQVPDSAGPAGGAPGFASPSMPQQPIIVVTGGEGNSASTQYLTTMLGMFSAMDAWEKKTQAPWDKFLSRGSMMRQNMFGHGGKAGTAHQAVNRDVSNERFDALTKKLDKLADSIDKKGY